MHIIITTENKAKVQAVCDVFSEAIPNCTFHAEKFSSDIADQPTSEEEAIQGALNRAQNAQQKHTQADLCIGMEGYVHTNSFGMFLGGVVVIIDQNQKKGIGVSAKLQIPPRIQTRINQGEELGPIIQTILNDTQNTVRHNEGTNGILSQGLYTRIDEFKDATKCALAPFLSPQWYK